MQRENEWQPTKFIPDGRSWTASRDTAELGAASRMVATLAVRAYVDALQSFASGRLVDLGCGKVPLYGAYCDSVDAITCVDWPQSVHTTSHVDIEVDLSSSTWPLSDDGFDTVVLTDVLEHLAYPDQTWAELARITAPNGVLIIGVPFTYWLHEEPNDHHRYTEFRLRRFCADHGFAIEYLEPFGGPLNVIADVMGKRLTDRKFLRALVPGLQRLGLRYGHPSRQIPVGYVLVARQERR